MARPATDWLTAATYADSRGRQPHTTSEPEMRVLLPIIRAQAAAPLMAIGDALMREGRGSGNVLGLVEVPAPPSSAVAGEVVRRRRELLRWIAASDQRLEQDAAAGLGILVRVVHDVALGIREAAYETNSNLIAVEWPGVSSRRPRLLASVIQNLSDAPPADMLLLRPSLEEGHAPPRVQSILVPVRGGPNAGLAVRVGGVLAKAWGAHLTVLHLVNSHHHPDRQAQESRELWDLLVNLDGPVLDLVERQTDHLAGALLAAARGADMVVLGASADSAPSPVLVRSELAWTLRKLTGTILLARSLGSLPSGQGANGRGKAAQPGE